MIKTLAISNYRSLLDLTIPLDSLNVITGPNGSGKSNVYKALRLLAETASGGIVNSLAREGGLPSTFWAGPADVSKKMKSGEVPIQGTHNNKNKRLHLGFSGDDFGYAISMGVTPPIGMPTAFSLDPEIKRESIWAGPVYRPASSLVEREGPLVKVRADRGWDVIAKHTPPFECLFERSGDSRGATEISQLKDTIASWRFYDHFRTDHAAPSRLPQLGTRTPVLDNDGRDLAAALQTIREIGDEKALDEAIEDAFPGCAVDIDVQPDNRFALCFRQHGLLRTLCGSELSDGTLRYLLWIAVLLTPRPPPLMVLNEPETSLHPDLLPALGRLISRASLYSQVWVVSHAAGLIDSLASSPNCASVELQKTLGQTEIRDQRMFDKPAWQWPK